MNSKQRKQADKMRERALLDLDHELKKVEVARERLAKDAERITRSLEKDRADFEDMKKVAMEKMATSRAVIQQDREDLTVQVQIHSDNMKAERHEFVNRAENLENVSILRDVLVALECDIDPIEIAAKLRKDFGLLIPQW